MSFVFKGNYYNQLYSFPKPDSVKRAYGLDYYHKCEGYTDMNEIYHEVPTPDKRQARLHTCFPSCKEEENQSFEVDVRPACSDIPSDQRDTLMCLYPEESCEFTLVADEVKLSSDGTAALSPSIAIIAFLAANPI